MAIIGAYFLFQNVIRQQIAPRTISFIKEETDIDVELKSFKLSFAKLLQFQPVILIKELNIENSIQVKKIFVKLYLKPLLQKRFEIKQIVIDGLELRLEENSKHQASVKGINPEKIQKAIEKKKKENEKKKKSQPNLVTNFELKRLAIKNSTIWYQAYQAKKPFKISPISAELVDISYGGDNKVVSQAKFTAKLFNSKSSELVGTASIGPFPLDLKYIPISGKQTITVYINDMPEADRIASFGTLLINDAHTRITEQSQFTGDLLGNVRGNGTVEIKDLLLGQTKAHHLNVSSTIPVYYSLRLNQEPNLKLESKNAKLNLKGNQGMQGLLNFDTYISYDLDTTFMDGSSHGKLSGLEIEEALNCFTKHRKLISGTFEIPEYHVYFKGGNAKQIANTVKANGSINIKDGSLYILRNLTKYKDIAGILVKNGDEITEKLSGQFASLKSDFKYLDKELFTDNINLQTTSKLGITGSGAVRAGDVLDYAVIMTVPGLQQTIPFTISGTISKPKIHPDIKSLSKQQSQQLINSALEYGLGALKKYAEKNSKTASTSTSTGDTTTPSTTSTETSTTATSAPKSKKKKQAEAIKLGTQLLGNILTEVQRQQTTTTTSPTVNGTPATVNGTGL